jgi:hypothetical protein
LLGAEKVLREDSDYYSFKPSALTPRKGLGLMGIIFLLPGMFLAGRRCLSRKIDPALPRYARFNTAVLLSMTIGAFVMCHLVFRWQSIGVLRLMYPFVIAGAPLSALLLEKRWLRMAALGLLLVSAVMFLTFWLGHLSRRLGWSERRSFALISRLQNSHGTTFQYQWRDQPACQLVVQEDYTYRETYEKLLEGMRQPSTIGFIGHSNSECNFLFGKKFQNRVIPLVDSRSPDRILEPASQLDYLVVVDNFAPSTAWAKAHAFEQIFEARSDQEPVVLAFGREGATARPH